MISKISIFIVGVFSVVAGIVSTEISNTSNITLPNDHLLRGTTIPVLTQEEIWEMDAMREAISAPRIGLNGEDRTVFQPREGSGTGRRDFTRPNLKRTRSQASFHTANLFLVMAAILMMMA